MGDLGAVDRLARHQHGVFNNRQLREAGFGKAAVQRRVLSGHWIQLDHRVFCLASAPATWNRQMSAALLSREKAIVGGSSAAYLHEMRGFRPARPTIVVPGSANARSEVARVIRSEHFVDLKTETINRFEVTTTAETIVCLASFLSLPRLADVFDDSLLSGSLHLDELEEILERESGRRRKGIVAVRDLASDRSPLAPAVDSSYLEAMLQMVLQELSIPAWSREHPVLLGDRRCRVDVFVPAWNLVIEADGRTYHMLKEDFESDRRRDNALAARGIQVLRFTYSMLRFEPKACRAAILDTGRLRSA